MYRKLLEFLLKHLGLTHIYSISVHTEIENSCIFNIHYLLEIGSFVSSAESIYNNQQNLQ